MSELIRELMDDHRTILTLLKRIRTGDLTTAERDAYLVTVRSVLQEHLHLEDVKLYPGLKEMAAPENKAAETVKAFTSGMDKIGSIINDFFNRNEFFDMNESDFCSIQKDPDFAKIIKLLEIRIASEEDNLYPLYEKLCNSN